MRIERFEDIEAWQITRELSHKIYQVTSRDRFAKDFSLRDQINRATGSSMDNIAEGFDSGSDAEFVRFLRYSQRSCSEVQSQLYRAIDREYLTQKQFGDLFRLATHARSKIGAFIKYLKK